MVRIGALCVIMLSLFILFGCKTTETQPTGLQLSFTGCVDFEAWVWIDNDYVGSYSSGHSWFVDVKTGGHTIYAKSNLIAGDSCFCWTQDFSITEGKTTFLALDCKNHGCCKSATSAAGSR